MKFGQKILRLYEHKVLEETKEERCDCSLVLWCSHRVDTGRGNKWAGGTRVNEAVPTLAVLGASIGASQGLFRNVMLFIHDQPVCTAD